MSCLIRNDRLIQKPVWRKGSLRPLRLPKSRPCWSTPSSVEVGPASSCRGERHGRMTGRAAAIGLPRLTNTLCHALSAPNEQPRQGSRDPRVAASARRVAAATRWHKARFSPADRVLLAALLRRLPRQTFAQAPPADPPGHRPTLAPRPASPTPRRRIPTETPGTTPRHTIHPPPGPSLDQGEPELGLPSHPWRTARTRKQGRRVDCLADPQGCRDRSGGRARLDHLVDRPPLPSRCGC
jgi:hypothetical protein